jgi:hypothetical protein
LKRNIKPHQTENSENVNIPFGKDFLKQRILLLVYQDYKDVRLVAHRPIRLEIRCDTDNWNGQDIRRFFVFRILAVATGNPAEYSASNTPRNPNIPSCSMKGTSRLLYDDVGFQDDPTDTLPPMIQQRLRDYHAWVLR